MRQAPSRSCWAWRRAQVGGASASRRARPLRELRLCRSNPGRTELDFARSSSVAAESMAKHEWHTAPSFHRMIWLNHALGWLQ